MAYIRDANFIILAGDKFNPPPSSKLLAEYVKRERDNRLSICPLFGSWSEGRGKCVWCLKVFPIVHSSLLPELALLNEDLQRRPKSDELGPHTAQRIFVRWAKSGRFQHFANKRCPTGQLSQ